MSPHDDRVWMWADALTLWERADRLQRQCFQLGASAGARPTWEPPLDLVESEAGLSIIVALPGVRAESVKVIVDGPTLTVLAERAMPAGSADATLLRLEIPYGRFERRVQLPPGRFEIAERALADGCLVLQLRRMG